MKIKKDKVKIITLGCSKNLVDSEHIMSQLKAGNEITLRGECSGFLMDVLLNNCALIK